MKTFILALDGCDSNKVEQWQLDNLKQSQYGKFESIIGRSENGLSQIFTNLVPANIKSSYEIDIAYMISPKINMHNTRHELFLFRLVIVVYTLN